MKTGEMPLKPDNSHFTDKQWQAIYDGDDNLLISASAGSGKTTVLVERVIQHIKSGINVDELLIVTYTEAAAKEMKQRIEVAIQKAVEEASNKEKRDYLMRQLTLLKTASISTFHSFCLTVIRKYYYLIHIDPVFRLLTDETEIALLKEDVWHKVREELYGEDKERFYQLTENFSNDRNDDGLTELIFSMANFALANTEPLKWLDQLNQNYHFDGDLIETKMYQEQMKPLLMKELTELIEKNRQISQSISGEPEFQKTLTVLESDSVLIETLLKEVQTNQIDACFQLLSDYKFMTIKGPSKKNSTEEMMAYYETVKKERDIIKKQVNSLKSNYFSLPKEKVTELIKKANPLIEEMVFVCKKFLKAYDNEKKKKSLVDFNDLEHLTLAILRQLDNGEWLASEASLYYRNKFKEVMVDEYQDVNRLQEGILYWLRKVDKSQNGNLFMVGDVKQSIYAFRLADPTLFIEKYEQFAHQMGGKRIVLAENFRSRSQVLDFTNLVFAQLMDKELGQIEYDKNAELITGFTAYPENKQADTEFLIYESESEMNEDTEELTFEIDDKVEGELLLVGNKIKELIASKYPIYDKKEKIMRPICYKDIVILSSTKKNNLTIVDVFKKLRLPIVVNDAQNYFQATEIKIMMALLQIIDNPYQDIPLVAVLRSPIVGLKENELVTIRQYEKKGYFYDALLTYLKEESQVNHLSEKLSHFEEQLVKWRDLSRREKLVHLIWTIYQDSGLLEYVGGMPSGKQRQANLHALYERASVYEESSFKGLFQFVRFIEKMQDKDKDLAEANVSEGVEDAVRVMTIHASKGLEFPVVFVIELNKQFNLKDINNKSYIFDESFGVGIKYLENKERLKYATLPFTLIREKKKRKMLAEEMRKLYVALTRAEEKLYLVGSLKNKETALKDWQNGINSDELTLSVNARLAKRSLLGWLGLTIIRHPNVIREFPEITIEPLKKLETINGDFKLSFVSKEALQEIKTHEEETALKEQIDVSKPEPKRLKEIVEQLDFRYPFETATFTTSYQSISEIKRVFEDPDNQELNLLDLSQKEQLHANRLVNEELARPKFLSQLSDVTPAEVGTGTHLIMQLIHLSADITEDTINSLITTLTSQKVLKKEVAEKIDQQSILTFFKSEFGQFLLTHAKEVKREQPFSLLLQANRIFQNVSEQSDDQILLHGIIDGFVETNEELVLYDFKTDHVPNDLSQQDLENIKKKYSGQLNLYKMALEQITEKKVTSVKLILLKANKQIEMLN